jgi:rubrerythrin
MATRGQVEYEDYVRSQLAQGKPVEVFICGRCDHPLKSKDDKCPQCDPK